MTLSRNVLDLLQLKLRMESQAKGKTFEVEAGQRTWFFCRQLHFVGVGQVMHMYPRDIGHGPETPLCKVKGQIMDVGDLYKDFHGIIHQDDICHSKKDAIRSLMMALNRKGEKRRGEMIDLISLEAQWGRKL